MDFSKLIKVASLLAVYYPQIADLVSRFITDLNAAKPLMQSGHCKPGCEEVARCLDAQAAELIAAIEHNAHLYGTLCCDPCPLCESK